MDGFLLFLCMAVPTLATISSVPLNLVPEKHIPYAVERAQGVSISKAFGRPVSCSYFRTCTSNASWTFYRILTNGIDRPVVAANLDSALRRTEIAFLSRKRLIRDTDFAPIDVSIVHVKDMKWTRSNSRLRSSHIPEQKKARVKNKLTYLIEVYC